MAKTVVYLFGTHDTDGENPIYDDSGNYPQRIRLYFCDEEIDLPADLQEKDLAICFDSHKLYFARNGEWTSIKGEKE